MKLLTAFLISSICQAGYTHSVSITFDHTKAPSTQTNYTAMVCANGGTSTNCDSAAHTNLSLPNLKVTGSGGAVTSSSGFDIGIFTDTNCTVSTNYELDYYSSTTGRLVMHVLISSFSSSSDTVRYLCFANASITTNQSSTATWNSGYKMVQHFADGSSLSVTDSTSNANNGTTTTNVSALANGQIDGAVGMNLNPNFQFGTSATVETQDITIELWVALQFSNNQVLVAKSDLIDGHGWVFMIRGFSNLPSFVFHDAGGTHGWYSGTTGVPVSPNPPSPWPTNAVWHHAVMTWTSGTVKFYVDGALTDTVATASGTINYSSDVLRIGNQATEGSLTGAVDEVRISNVVLSADYVTTAYNNQSSPSTFYTFGADTNIGGGIRHRRTI